MNHYLGFLLFLVNIMACSTMPTTELKTYDLAIKNVKIFDSKTKKVTANQTILIKGDEIANVIDATETFKATTTIEGNNRLVSPGFIDTHVHLNNSYSYNNNYGPEILESAIIPTYKKMLAREFLNYGTTTIIDMGQPDEWVEETITWQKNPSPDFPNIFINGSSIISDEKRRPAWHHLEVASPEEATKKVKEYKDLGLKYMKLYSRLRMPEMKAIVQAAQKEGITLNAHVDNNIVTIPQAMDLGVRNFEHFFTLTPSILAYNEHWVLMDDFYKLKGIKGIDDFTATMVFFFGYIQNTPAYTNQLHRLLDRMSQENATLSTALHVLASVTGKTDFYSSFNEYPIRSSPELNQHTPQHAEQLQAAFEAMMTFIKTAHDKGVKIRIGTDCLQGGRSLLSELILLAKAGISTADILQIATWNGYQAMKLTEQYGTIEKGKKADLLIFDQNPLENYEHFSADKTIIKGGKLYTPQTSAVFTFLDKVFAENTTTATNYIEAEKAKDFSAINPYEMRMVAYHLAASAKVDESLMILKKAKAWFPNMPELIPEDLLNGIGYHYLNSQQIEQALDIFKWNVERYPNSWNVYDSLGEGYKMAGETKLAIENYEKSIELNPENEEGKKILEELKK